MSQAGLGIDTKTKEKVGHRAIEGPAEFLQKVLLREILWNEEFLAPAFRNVAWMFAGARRSNKTCLAPKALMGRRFFVILHRAAIVVGPPRI